MLKLSDLEKYPAFAKAREIGNEKNFEDLGPESVRELLHGVSLPEALAETEKIVLEKGEEDEKGRRRYKFKHDASGPALLGLARLLDDETDKLLRDAAEMVARVDKNSHFWETFDDNYAREKEKTREELSQYSAGSRSRSASVQPEVFDVDLQHLDGEANPAVAVPGGNDNHDVAPQSPASGRSVVDENVDPVPGRPKRNPKKVNFRETGESGLAGTTVPARRRKRKRKAKQTPNLNIIEDAELQVVNDELANEMNEVQNNSVLPFANSNMEGGSAGLFDVERQTRLMREKNLMLPEEPVDLENNSNQRGQNENRDAEGFGFDNNNPVEDDVWQYRPSARKDDLFTSLSSKYHGAVADSLEDISMTSHDVFPGAPTDEFATPGPSTSHQSVERGRREESNINEEGASQGPNLNLPSPSPRAKSADSTINQQTEQPAAVQSSSNIQQASAVELPQVNTADNGANQFKKYRRKKFADLKPKIKLNYKGGEEGTYDLLRPYEPIELPGKIPKPLQKSDFDKVFGRPTAALLQDMVLNIHDQEQPLVINLEIPHPDAAEELSTMVVAEEYPTILENDNDQGTHNDTTHVVNPNTTPADPQPSNEQARDNDSTNLDEVTPNRFKRPRDVSKDRSSINVSQRTGGAKSPEASSWQNRVPSPALSENMAVACSPDMFSSYDDNLACQRDDEIMAIRNRVINAAYTSTDFSVEFDPRVTTKLTAARAFFQAMVVTGSGLIDIVQKVPTCEEITKKMDRIYPLELVPHSIQRGPLPIMPAGHVATYFSTSASRSASASKTPEPKASTSRTVRDDQPTTSPVASTSRAALARFK